MSYAYVYRDRAVEFEHDTKMSRDYFAERWAGAPENARPILDDILADIDDSQAAHFIDAGCFVGFYGVMVAALRPHVLVHAFDINPAAVITADANFTLNGCSNYRVICAGLGSAYGPLWYKAHQRDNIQSLTMLDDGDGVAGHSTAVCMSLDDYFGHPDPQDVAAKMVFKIDVEGFEGYVLNGMTDLVASDHVQSLYIEYHHRLLINRMPGWKKSNLTSPLADKGFNVVEYPWQAKNHEFWRVRRDPLV